MPYRVLVLLHLIGVLLFFANLGVAFTLMLATRHETDAAVLAHSYRVLHRVDLWLTPISVVLILGAGWMAGATAGLRLIQPWVTRPLLAFAVSGAVFLGVVLPAQRALVRRGAALAVAGGTVELAALRRRWFAGAALATAAALAAVALMVVVRPA